MERSRLNEPVNLDKVQKTWYVKSLKMLGQEITKENAREIFDNVAFIVFNYDRCIEQFLRYGLRFLYGLPEKEAEDICDDLQLIHPYGYVADLPMQGKSPGGVPFGDHDYGSDHVGLAENIRTYTEQILDADLSSRIHAEMLSAGNIVFLGFAFHPQNMHLLTPEEKLGPKTIFGTAYGMSDDDIQTITGQLFGMFRDPSNMMAMKRVKLNNKLTCADLFDYYARSLTA